MKVLLLVALCVAPALSLGMVGGYSTVDPTGKEVQEAASFAVQSINRQANSMYADMLYKVVSAQTQVVAGINYKLTLQMVMSTECRNDGQAHTLESCAYDMSSLRSFDVVVYSRPWDETPMKLLSFEQLPEKVNSNSLEDEPVEAETVNDVLKASDPQFSEFIAKFKPSYASDVTELKKRSEIFSKNLRTIKKMNQAEQGTARYGVTKFADLTAEEFRQQYAMPLGVLKPDPTMKQAPKMDVSDIPDSVDWREKGVVTAVKNQGSCGSCWAFSTTGNIEGQWAIKKGQLVSLSEQELVDCDKVDKGCEGGLPSNAYKQIMSLGGLETESVYPYSGRDGSCKFSKSKVAVNINGSLALSTDEQQMAAWLAANGPISIGINAAAMQFYFGGISHPWKIFCNPSHLDHGVLIVGYGTDGEKPYWIIKNSWGGSWGEKGYYLVYRGDGVCGLNKMPTSSTVA